MKIEKIIIYNLNHSGNHPPVEVFMPKRKIKEDHFLPEFEKAKEKYKHEEEDTRSKHTPLDGLHLIGWDACTRCPLWANLQRKEGET